MDLVSAKFNRLAKISMLTILLAGGFCFPEALAAKKTVEPATKDGLSELKVSLRLPQTAPLLEIAVTNADFRLVHEARSDIEVRTNYPQHWSVDDSGKVQQIDFAKCAFGVYHTQNGSNFIGTGTTGESDARINMGPEGIFINGKALPLESRVSKPSSVGMVMEPDGLFINGHRVMNGSSDPNSPKELDVIQIVVPTDFQGALKIKTSSTLRGVVDSWTGQSITVASCGLGEYTVGAVNGKCSLSVENRSSVEVADINGVTVVNSQDAGKIKIKHLSGDSFALNSGGKSEVGVETADVQIVAVSALAQSAVTLGGNFSSEVFKGNRVDLTASDTSKILLQEADVEDCTVKTAGSGRIDVSGAFYSIEEPTGSAGGIKIKMVPREKQ